MSPTFHGDALKYCQDGREYVVEVGYAVIKCPYLRKSKWINSHVSIIQPSVKLKIHSRIAIISRCALSDARIAESFVSGVYGPGILFEFFIENRTFRQVAPIMNPSSP